ncbi:MAG: nucleotide exchange factor GrpE [Candidatus Omnitrophica bacterium]|nr:nucleotide exchange factor GrpE [Candidatus Omnitrophota bacterium]
MEDNKNNSDMMVSKKEYEALQDKYLRACAELENTKKRLEKEKTDSVRYANDVLILEFLPILDNLEIAEKHIKEAKDFKAVQEGVDMIQLQMQGFLKEIGVERIKTVGEKFDPHQHEVVEVVESEEKSDGLIVEELKPGYRINGRLLRPAFIKIGKKKDNGK